MATHHSTSSKQLFQIGSFLAFFRVPNFLSRFEALNDVVLGITWEIREIAFLLLFYLLNVLLSGTFPMVSQMTQTEIVRKSYAPEKVGLPIYHFGVN